jgi:hypothetical protein
MTTPTPDTLPATTTAEEDRHTHSARARNRVWELTQAGIAIAVTAALIAGELSGGMSDTLRNAFFLVIGFYFGRTNHARPRDVIRDYQRDVSD